jgi:valyl-tRNA synthetase
MGKETNVHQSRYGRWSAWLHSTRWFTLIVLAWLPMRAGLLMALYLHRVLRSDPNRPFHAMNHVFSPWMLLLLLLVPVLLAWRFVRIPASLGEGTTDLPSPAGRGGGGEGEYTLADSWIWARLQQLIRDVERLFQTFQYGEAGRQIYEFIWSDFADWYVEIAKGQLANDETRTSTAVTLARIFNVSMRLLHPFTPFITEEIWGHLRRAILDSPIADIAADWPEALIVARFPEPREPEGWEESKLADFTIMQDIVRSIRNLRAEKNVSPAKRLAAQLSAGDKTGLLKEQAAMIASLAGLDVDGFKIEKSIKQKPKDSVALVVGSVEIYLPLAGMVDLADEKARLEKELKETESHIERLEKLLASDFANKAPTQVVGKEREKLASYKETAEKIKAQLKN